MDPNLVPPTLKSLKPYLTHAKQTERFDKLIAYYCNNSFKHFFQSY